jgi:prevent-host-death family protein
MKSVGIRELKNRLSDYLRTVRAGEPVLVTDRGQTIAEICPLAYAVLPENTHPGLAALSVKGRITLGARNEPDLYPELSPIMPEGTSAELLDEMRGKR